MEKALVMAGIFIVPTVLLVIGVRRSGRKMEWVPLLWAGFACLVYMLLLLHQAFGKGLKVWGAETGWGLWLVTVIFGLLHGKTGSKRPWSVRGDCCGSSDLTGGLTFLLLEGVASDRCPVCLSSGFSAVEPIRDMATPLGTIAIIRASI